MASSYHMDVFLGVNCIVCDQRKVIHSENAKYRPTDYAEYLRNIGWMYNNDKGWTCADCVARNPAKKAARTRGLMKRVEKLSADLAYETGRGNANMVDWLRKDLQDAMDRYMRLK